MKNTLLILAISTFLTACGGGGGGGSNTPDPAPEPAPILGCTDENATNYNAEATQDDGSCTYPPETSQVTGKAFDGYIVGGTAYLDINGNGALDEGEPSSVTQAGGDYSIEMTEEQAACLPWSAMYVDVPVGAIDESEGEVTEAYVMAFPPSLDPDQTQEGINVSPLTTVVWDTVATKLRETNRDISCATLSTDESLTNFIRSTIDSGIEKVVKHYNVPREKIYSDFIADGDVELQAKAVEIVSGLQAGLAHTIELQEQNPDSRVSVSYVKGSSLDADFGYPDKWYREVWIWPEEGGRTYKVVRMESDLVTEEKVIMQEEKLRLNEDGYIVEDVTIWESRHDGAPYICSITENILWDSNSDVTDKFIVTNIRQESDIESFESCSLVADTSVMTQYIFVLYSESDLLKYSAQFSFENYVPFGSNMIVDNASTENFENWETAILTLPYVYTDRGVAGSQLATRIQNEEFVEGEVGSINTIVAEYPDGSEKWTRITNYTDDTRSSECSVDGANWGEC